MNLTYDQIKAPSVPKQHHFLLDRYSGRWMGLGCGGLSGFISYHLFLGILDRIAF